ncbi:MAG: SPO1 DNA polymerase [Gammaproteobacteria bacterium]|nr:uracil-DNA glycosylase [Gammaproteobacteria bacterium]PCH64447.1 MAG: SPO1 DNA polymerase [Gammaproteobacteria bacterium]
MDTFDLNCRDCPRLATFLDEVKEQYPDYHARPVAPFGAAKPRVLIVGLAPGMHGANATGRPFTGDYAGVLLYKALYQYGFASAEESVSSDDGLKLIQCKITNAVKCLPPENKPITDEIKQCNQFLKAELNDLIEGSASSTPVVFTLGGIAHSAVLRAMGLKLKAYPFGHGVAYDLPSGHHLISSYHCSRYNTQTRRLTEDMFMQVLARIRTYVDA